MSQRNKMILFGLLLFLIASSTEITEHLTKTKLQGGESCTPGTCPEGYGCQPREFPNPAYPGICVPLTTTTTTTTTTTGATTTTTTTEETTTDQTTSYTTTYTSEGRTFTSTVTSRVTKKKPLEIDEAKLGRNIIMIVGLIVMMWAFLLKRR